jgi:4'-phosphopantetheinyl transferase
MHYFSEREYDSLQALSDEKLYQTFFTYWTRKEAYIKGSGEGLELLNKRLDVISAPDQGLPLPDVNGSIHWFLYDLEAAPTYLAALAVQQRDVDIVHCW